MKKIYLIFIVFLAFSSCFDLEKKEKQCNIYSSNFKEINKINPDLNIINLDSISRFSELRTQIEELSCDEQMAGVKFTLNDTIYHLLPFAECPDTSIIVCYPKRNVLLIENNSIVYQGIDDMMDYKESNKKTPLDSLSYIIKDLNLDHSKQLKPLVIYYEVDDKHSILTIKKGLKEILNQIEKGKPNNLECYIELWELPPPPPIDLK